MNRNTKTSINVKDTDANTPGTSKEKIEIIEEYFKSTLAPKNMATKFLTVPPCKKKTGT
jgi:hypothetical protein